MLGSTSQTAGRVRWYRVLYVQVLLAIVLGVCVGWWFPNLGPP